ncbi:exodeoxyribonuclease VII large subunit [Streptococcus sp. DD12]|uniref:exodeoxyribonuclease VII large subunit n=1 Tax=Streptococcus sp. DD12 TaxID=1777880 RepID=UPI000799F930|nr:exodeoxyribonuclease VII large subunit [Streptococcus sp. DD12]KXT75337.1 Exodeoxyribonuclease VII large subunit [Streptococcus sp. DD12]
MSDYLTVTQLNKYLGLKFSKDPYLERVYLKGQVSNFRKRPNHQYFSLKDEGAAISATMWASQYRKLGFDLENDMQVNVVGRVQIYEKTGQYSIVIEEVIPDGVGALALQFEQLKKKLLEAGYFDQQHKQPIPRFVSHIGVVTSRSGAVIHDIQTTVARRFPGVSITLYPTKVQGTGAAKEVAENIRRANADSKLDVLIVARGGGSIEDLWAFNEELVVQAIFESRLPVISSIGHETDTTLSDLVSDDRAATPTAAAEHATPVTKADVLARLSELRARAYRASNRQLEYYQERLKKLQGSSFFRQPERLYDAYLQRLDQLQSQLLHGMRQQYLAQKNRLLQVQQGLNQRLLQQQVKAYQERLNQDKRLLQSQVAQQYDAAVARFEKAKETLLSLDTSRIVSRGYAVVSDETHIVSSVKEVQVGQSLTVQMQDGQIDVEVKDVRKD